jgi:hypothetical protein
VTIDGFEAAPASGQDADRDRLIWNDPVMESDRDSGGASTVDDLLRAGSTAVNQTLFVLSAGFDPRCIYGLERFVEAAGDVPNVLAVEPEPGDSRVDSPLVERRAANVQRLEELATRSLETISYPNVHDEASAGRVLAQTIASADRLKDFRSILFDLSAFPTSIAFTPLHALLSQCGTAGLPSELQVLVTENPALDTAIEEGGLGAAHALPGFGRHARRERAPSPVRVWTPVLGVGAGPSMRKIAEILDPQEVCPIVPFPARDPRLVDQLLLEHRQLLMQEYSVQPTSLIYAAETNPFDLYRTLVRFDRDYQLTLGPVGGARVSVSTHGSKLLSIGALLAAFEQDLPMYSVRATTHKLAADHWEPESRADDRLACLWLRGEPYKI